MTSNGEIGARGDGLVNAETEALLPDDSDTKNDLPKLKLYKRRWYILVIFTMVGFLQSGLWNTWGPIANSCTNALGWSTGEIGLLANWGPIMFVIMTPFMSWLLDAKGLRWATVLSIVLVWLGAGLRCFTLEPPLSRILIHAGHILNAIPGPPLMGGPPLLSATWFPAHQRTFSTAFVVTGGSMGVAVSFILGPNLVPDYLITGNQTICSNSTLPSWNTTEMMPIMNCTTVNQDNTPEIKKGIMLLMYSEFGLACLLLLLTLVYFPARPPTAPTISASSSRLSYKQGLLALLRNRKFWVIGFAYAVSTGVFFCWQSVLDVNLQPLGILESTASWLGFWSTVAGNAGCIVLSIFADIFSRRMKTFLIILYILASVCFAILAISCQGVIPITLPLLYSTVLAGSMFLMAAIPLYYELVCEVVYPVAEGITNILLTCLNNLSGFVFLSFLFIKTQNNLWMNWTLMGSIIICIPVLMLLGARYTRIDIDTGVLSADTNGKIVDDRSTIENQSTVNTPDSYDC